MHDAWELLTIGKSDVSGNSGVNYKSGKMIDIRES